MNEKSQKLIKETKDDTKIILASMIIPFLYMLLSLVEYALTYPFNDPTHHPILWTEWIAGYFLFMLIPPILIAFSIVPKLKAKVTYKKFFEYLTISSWVFVFICWFLEGVIYNFKVQ